MDEDIELTLLNHISENWGLRDDLGKDNIAFHRNMRKVEGILQQPHVVSKENVDALKWDKEGMAECLASIIVQTRVQSNGTTNVELENTKKLKTEMRTEILRILKEADKPDGWEWAHVTRRVNGDNFDVQPALLGEDLYVTVAYQRSG